MKIKKYATLAGLIVALSLWIGCGDESEKQEVVRPVKMFTIEGLGAEGGRQYPGKVEANQDVPLTFEVSGKLIEFVVSEGQDVAKGDLIARIDPERNKNTYLKAQADYNQAEKDYQRNKTLYENGAIAASELDTFLRSRDVAQADLKNAKRDLNDTVLRAPFAGVVARKVADNFENVTAGQEIVRLQDLTLLLIKVSVPEVVVSSGNESRLTVEQLNQRLNASMRLTTNEETQYEVYLKDVETEADPATRTYQATFALNSPDQANILPGMTAVVEVEPTEMMQQQLAEIKPVYLIPTTAVAADPDGKQYAWVVDAVNMQVSRQTIETGEVFDDQIQVLSGLAPGMTVVTAGVNYLRAGQKVSRMPDPSDN
ncbi:MAG: efflux RND transporter periplasmic adaptor subunit [Verrucomicrobiota bacterium]